MRCSYNCMSIPILTLIEKRSIWSLLQMNHWLQWVLFDDKYLKVKMSQQKFHAWTLNVDSDFEFWETFLSIYLHWRQLIGFEYKIFGRNSLKAFHWLLLVSKLAIFLYVRNVLWPSSDLIALPLEGWLVNFLSDNVISFLFSLQVYNVYDYNRLMTLRCFDFLQMLNTKWNKKSDIAKIRRKLSFFHDSVETSDEATNKIWNSHLFIADRRTHHTYIERFMYLDIAA